MPMLTNRRRETLRRIVLDKIQKHGGTIREVQLLTDREIWKTLAAVQSLVADGTLRRDGQHLHLACRNPNTFELQHGRNHTG
jgi:hypothetical protein